MKRIVCFIVALIVFSAGAEVFAQSGWPNGNQSAAQAQPAQRLTFAIRFEGFNTEAAKIAIRSYFPKYLEMKYPGKYLVVSGDTAQHYITVNKTVWESSGQEEFFVQPGQKLDRALSYISVGAEIIGAIRGYGSRSGQIATEVGYRAEEARWRLEQPVQQWIRLNQTVGMSIKVDDFDEVSDLDTFQLFYFQDPNVPKTIVDDKGIEDVLLPPKAVGPSISMMLQSFRHRLDEFRF